MLQKINIKDRGWLEQGITAYLERRRDILLGKIEKKIRNIAGVI